MRLRQAHRHVEIVGSRGERPGEDGRHELRLDRVHHVRCTVLLGDLGDVVGVGCVDLCGDVTVTLIAVFGGDPGDRALRPGQVVVADDHRLEEGSACGDLRDRVADTAGAHQEDSHAPTVLPVARAAAAGRPVDSRTTSTGSMCSRLGVGIPPSSATRSARDRRATSAKSCRTVVSGGQ